jgi:dTDP-4-dehydrorhamnose reductase
MKILITGKSGQVGHDVCKSAPKDVDVVGYNHQQLDITSHEDLKEKITTDKPDVIINCAAYTAVDKAESERETAYKVNAIAVGNLAELANDISARLIHISTDFVFDGNKSSPYQPDDERNPISIYGKSKAQGEHLLQENNPDASVILRSSWIYSLTGRNFVKTMLELFNTQDEIRVVSDQVGAPTYSKNLALTIWSLVKSDIRTGIYHWCDTGVASWYDLALATYEISHDIGLINRDINFVPITTSQYPTAARRPPYSLLDISKTQKVWGAKPEYWRTALKKMLVEYTRLLELTDHLLK